jgi:NO-binding membrane sensor protein with MHYT domain
MRRIGIAAQVAGAIALALIGMVTWDHVLAVNGEVVRLEAQVAALKVLVEKIDDSTSRLSKGH